MVNDRSHQLHHDYCCEKIFLKFRGKKQKKHVLVAHNSVIWSGLSCLVLLALQEISHFIGQAGWLRAGLSWITGLFSLSVWDAFEVLCWRRCLKSSLESKKIKLVNPKGNQPWIFIGRTDSEAPIFWSPDEKSQLTGKDPNAGKDWRQGEKGMAEDEMVGWHHCLNGHEFEQAPEDGDGQGSLACCSQSMRSQRVGHSWVTDQQQPSLCSWLLHGPLYTFCSAGQSGFWHGLNEHKSGSSWDYLKA